VSLTGLCVLYMQYPNLEHFWGCCQRMAVHIVLEACMHFQGDRPAAR
jgi:hypothetical protein